MENLMQLHLFGAATPTGESFREHVANSAINWQLHSYSRRSNVRPVDFLEPASFNPAGDLGAPAIWVSFGPIFLLAPFLHALASNHPERLSGLKGLIACSSSSVVTKRFATNSFDSKLVGSLARAEDQLLATCRSLSISCCILRPTLIYGKVGPYSDSNLSRLLQQLRRLPVLPLPADAGLRQPIHASQLAAVALDLAEKLYTNVCDSWPNRILLGGDTTLTYFEMILGVQQAQLFDDPARSCRLLQIPNRLFFFLAAPLLLRSPKAFEAVLRMGANLSGFTTSHQLLGKEPQPFPVLPLA